VETQTEIRLEKYAVNEHVNEQCIHSRRIFTG